MLLSYLRPKQFFIGRMFHVSFNEFIESPQERVKIKQPQAFLQCFLFFLLEWLQEVIPYRVKWFLEDGKTFPIHASLHDVLVVCNYLPSKIELFC